MLSSVLQRNIYMEEIDLEGNQIEAAGAKYLAAVLKDNVSVKELVSVNWKHVLPFCNANVRNVDTTWNQRYILTMHTCRNRYL